MDNKTGKNNQNKVKSELAALFEDVQNTLDSSIMNERAGAFYAKKDSEDTPEKKATVGVKTLDTVPQSNPVAESQATLEFEDERQIYANPDSDFGSIFDNIKRDGLKKPESVQEQSEEEPIEISTLWDSAPSVARATTAEPEAIQPDSQEPSIDYELLEALGGDFTDEPELEKPHDKHQKAMQPPVKKFNILFKASAKEYTAQEQSKEIFRGYQKIFMSLLVQFAVCTLLFFTLVYLELASFLNLWLPDNLAFFSSVYILINLQILIFIGFTARKSLLFGLLSILRNELNLYAAASLFFAFAFVHTTVAYILRYNVALFNSVAALAVLSALIYNILDISFEIAGFKATAAKRLKYALTLDNNAPKEREIFRDIIPQDTSVARVSKTAFAANFFARTGRYKNYGDSAKYIYVSVAAALVTVVAFIIMSRDVSQIITAAVFILLGSLPLCSFISAAYPAFRAQRKSQATGAAFIGANSIEENAELAILSISDKDIFPPSTVKLSPGVKVYGNNRLDDVLHYLCALFAKLDLPAAEVFKSSVDWDQNKAAEANILIKDITELGICYQANGIDLFAGKPDYIENLGLRAPVDPDFDEQFLKSSGSMMLLASENEVIAKIYLKYELTANFHDMLKNIKRLNSCVCVKTFDPNIDDELLHKLSNIKKFPLKVLKLKDEREVYKIEEKLESGIISRDSLKSMINALLIISRVNRTIRSNNFIHGIAFFFNLALAAGLIFFAPISLSAWILLSVQAFWAVTTLFLSALTP